MLYRLKARFQNLVTFAAKTGLTPNGATVGGWIAAALFAAVLYLGLSQAGMHWLLLLVPVLATLRLAMNALDGLLARRLNVATAAGELANEASDILGDTLCYGVLFFIPNGPGLSLALFLLATWAAEFFGILGKALPGGIRRHESVGGGKPERALWISLFAIWAGFDHDAVEYLPPLLVVLSVLAALTAALRAWKSLKEAAGKPYQSYTAFGK